MEMKLHEIHPALVHAPLATLPLAGAMDLAASLNRDWAPVATLLWQLAAVSGVAAGVTGMAASQEVTPPDAESKDIMLRHGLINAALVAGAGGMACWRKGHPPTVASGCFGLLASCVAVYSAYLGGKMVYDKGMGAGETKAPRVLSKEAPLRLLKDAALGMRWLAASAASRMIGKRRQMVA